MGCGCLGPKQRRYEVYMEIIQSIHEEVQKITFVQSDTLDFYHAIKEKMLKKGLIRKLIDNLASHRNKINDSLHHNLQITLQKSNIQNKYAGLLIIDCIIQGIYQKNQQKAQQTQQFTSKSQSKSQQNSDFKFIKKNVKSIPHSITLQNSMMREVDSRFDLIYFKMIIYFLQTQPKMYSRVLKSLNIFCKNRKENFICVDIVWEVLAFIMTKIKKKYCLPQSTQTYSLLLEKTKQNFKDYEVEADLSLFIHLWLLDYSQNSKSNLNLGTLQSAEEQLVKINSIKIIQKYFHDSISNWNSNFLYTVIIQLYDQYAFAIQKLNSFQNIMQSIALKNDLNYHFFRGLIINLLEYLNFSSDIKRTSNTKSLSTGVSLQQYKLKNINVQNISVKLNAFKTLRRWISKKFMDLNEIINYNCSSLVFSYIDAFNDKKTDFSNDICKQFLKLVRQYLSVKSKQIVVLSLIQRIKWSQTQPKIRSLVIILIRQILEDENIFQSISDSFDYIIILQPNYSIQNSTQIIQLMGFMIKSVSKKIFVNMQEDKLKDNDEADSFKHKLCELLYSCYFLLFEDQCQKYYFKYQFCCAFISILKILYDNNCFNLLYSYEIEIQKKINEVKNIKQIKFYFIIWIAYEIKHLLFSKFKLPQQMLFINKKISTNCNEKQIQALISAFLQSFQLNNRKSKEQSQTDFKFQLQYKLKNNEKNMKIFDNFFNQKNERISRIIESLDEEGGFSIAKGYSTTNYFPKRDSVNESCDVSLAQDDKSFKDVMEVLHS